MDLFMKQKHEDVSSETNLQAIQFHGEGDYANVELKEQDLIKQLEKKWSSNIGDHSSPFLDCKLTLGPSGLTSNELLYMPNNCHGGSSEVFTVTVLFFSQAFFSSFRSAPLHASFYLSCGRIVFFNCYGDDRPTSRHCHFPCVEILEVWDDGLLLTFVFPLMK